MQSATNIGNLLVVSISIYYISETLTIFRNLFQKFWPTSHISVLSQNTMKNTGSANPPGNTIINTCIAVNKT